jgi:uncharacterized protein
MIESISSHATTAASTKSSPKARVVLLDAVRGFAVLGMLTCNAPDFAYPPVSAESVVLWPHGTGSFTVTIWALLQVVFQHKLYSLFSMLFGVSIVLVGGEGRDRPRTLMLARRLAWLIPIGLIHGLFVWWGDVLFSYAVTGLCVMFARGLRPTRLIAFGAAAFLGLNIYELAPHILKPAFVAHDLAPLRAYAARQTAAFSGSFQSSMRANIDAQMAWLPTQYLLFVQNGSLMLMGMGLYRLGVFTGDAGKQTYVWLVAAAAGILSILAFSTLVMIRSGFSPVASYEFEAFQAVLSPILALGYVALLGLSARTRVGAACLRLLAPPGQMAFTNYIFQSVIMTAIFYGGRGLGRFGQPDRPALMAIVLVVLATQVGWSHLWLRYFESGPLEWVWRRLYRGPSRFRRLMPSADLLPA